MTNVACSSDTLSSSNNANILLQTTITPSQSLWVNGYTYCFSWISRPCFRNSPSRTPLPFICECSTKVSSCEFNDAMICFSEGTAHWCSIPFHSMNNEIYLFLLQACRDFVVFLIFSGKTANAVIFVVAGLLNEKNQLHIFL